MVLNTGNFEECACVLGRPNWPIVCEAALSLQNGDSAEIKQLFLFLHIVIVTIIVTTSFSYV
jgi:hypothetical protein